jgi:hypothetical protein
MLIVRSGNRKESQSRKLAQLTKQQSITVDSWSVRRRRCIRSDDGWTCTCTGTEPYVKSSSAELLLIDNLFRMNARELLETIPVLYDIVDCRLHSVD